MTTMPINSGECILEPFWDSELCRLDKWEIQPDRYSGTTVTQTWCNTTFEWKTCSPDGTVLFAERRYEEPVPVENWDRLLLSVVVSNGCRVAVKADTDAGCCWMCSEPFGQKKRELCLDISAAHTLYAVQIQVYGVEGAGGVGWFNWTGLQSTEKLKVHLAQYEGYDARWEGNLHPLGIHLSFAPKYGIFLSADQLEKMRAFVREKRAEGIPFSKGTFCSDAYRDTPEKCIGEFVNFWNDTRFCRERDYGKCLLQHGVEMALQGVLQQDAEALRLAARYAMCILACTHWNDGFICNYTAGSWEHRCFVQSLCLYELVFIYDLAHEFFMPAAVSRLFRRLAEEGLASINYNTWRHEYIFHNNQLSWFSHGRMAAYSLLLKEWPRVSRYMDIAYDDVVENIQNTVLPDGGYVEGPGYFSCVGQNGVQALYLYANARGKAVQDVIPEHLKACVSFAAALQSTDAAQDMIPICDSPAVMPHAHLAFMAYLFPDSVWVSIFNRALARAEGLSRNYFALLMQSMALKSPAQRIPFVQMPEMHVAVSHRVWKDRDVKMLVMGNRGGAGHTHEDKGSFVLEYAGQTFAMDPGSCDYSSAYSLIYKHCQRHNMLVPLGKGERPAAQCPSPQNIPVTGSGDEECFHVSVEAGLAFPRYYQRWSRHIDSPHPAVWEITDDYAVREDSGCDGVEFVWNTLLPVERQGDTVVITGRSGRIVIQIPVDTQCALRTLEMFDHHFQNQIAFTRRQCSGRIVTRFTLEAI